MQDRLAGLVPAPAGPRAAARDPSGAVPPAPVPRAPVPRAARAPGGGRGAWGPAIPALALGLLGWLLLFREEAGAAVRTWESSAAYNHGWLILPIALYLAWVRRGRLSRVAPEPSALLALLALPAGLVWLAAERMGIMEGRQFAALGLLYVLVLSVAGWRAALAMAAPLAYLVFLVPFGEFAVPALQAVTARLVEFGLSLTGIPHYVDDLVIEIPAGTFYVAEACAGLRFIIAALAFGALYAFVMFRSPARRVVVMMLALAVPILANGARAFGLVLLGHYQGSAASVAADHVLYGWLFFSLVMLLLILIGLPFREDHRPLDEAPPSGPGLVPGTAALPAPPPRPAAALAAAALALGLAAGGPALAATMDRASGGPPRLVPARLEAPPGCEALADGSLRCGEASLSARLLVFHPRVNWRAVSSERRAAIGNRSDEDVTFGVPVAGGGSWRARQPTEGGAAFAAAAWLEGRAVGDGVGTRATQALRALRGEDPGAPVLAVVELRASGPPDAARERALLREVLEAQGPGLAARARALSRGS